MLRCLLSPISRATRLADLELSETILSFRGQLDRGVDCPAAPDLLADKV
jgi:hypothetical protein